MEWGGLTRTPVIDTYYMTIVTPNHRDKSDSSCVIECLASSFYFNLLSNMMVVVY